MLSKCANPPCSHRFRYLHEGKLFLLHSSRDGDSSLRVNFAGHIDGIQYAWLCDKCARKFEVVLDEEDNIKIRSQYPLSGLIASLGLILGLNLWSAATVTADVVEMMS